jgi:tetratricopeptide (TPR) repeat protein
LKYLFIIALACISVHSCVLLPTTPQSLNQKIDQLLTENEFDEIEFTLQRASKDDPLYAYIINRKQSINSKRTQYIDSTLAKADKFLKANKWQQALDTYNNALLKINNEPRLSNQKEALLVERNKQVTALRKDMLMKKANALVSYKIIYKKLQQLIPDDYSAQFDINRYENDRIEIAEHLMKCGEQALNKKQYILASECYSLSNKLEPTKQKAKLVSQINSELTNKSLLKRRNKLLAAYRSAYDKYNYNKARKYLNALLDINPSHPKANDLLAILNKEIDDQITSKINIGKDLYSKKKIDEALKIWQQALKIEPANNELIELINHAKKVSKKIRSLEQSQ